MVVTTFLYYGETVCTSVWVTELYPSNPDSSLENREYDMFELRDELDRALTTFDLPIIKIGGNYSTEACYSTSTEEARLYLATLIMPQPPGIFPFFELPPELRTKIYEMVMRYPISGLGVSVFKDYGSEYGRNHSRHFETITRDHFRNLSVPLWRKVENPVDVRDLPRSMNILLINKQALDEAVHCLYAINTFVARSISSLDGMMRMLATSRQQYLRHIGLVYRLHEYDKNDNNWIRVPSILASVANLSGLRKLSIDIEESQFLREKMGIWQIEDDSIDTYIIPGLSQLRKVRHRVEIVFEGDCPNVAAAFAAEEVPTIQTAGNIQNEPIDECL